MKKITTLLLVATSLILSVKSFAQSPDTKTAATILNGVSAKYKAYNSVKATFNMKTEGSNNKVTDIQTGTVYVKGNKYKLELANQEIFCDNIKIWTFLKDVNEVQVNNYEPDPDAITPTQIFTIYEKNFLCGYIEEQTINGKIYQIIEMTPNDKAKPYFKVRLMIDKFEKTIFSAKVFDKNGSHYTYEIIKFTPNPALIDTYFTFNTKDHPGVEVVDLR
ncbi:hypothetical protein LBMAG27_16010 [Bacteroidota bacterium]|nr:hypothetical protein LBMAG27_16010 [Bacteroidota bacterium]